MKQALNILLAYLTCTDPVMITKWENILASFWHKDDGQVLTNIAQNGTDWEFTTVDGDGNETVTTIAQYQEPANFPISKITGLQGALDGKVDKVTGKQLSTEDFTTTLKNKLDTLTQYVKPESEPIGYIDGLQDFLDALQDSINTLSDAVMQGNPVIIYVRGYRLYKESGNTEIYPQAGEEVKGRGDGSLFGGEIVHCTAKADIADPGTWANTDFNLIDSNP
ncbi:hypothetical protein BFP77_08380 [Maribacter sp. 4U21]|uniref:hypothetical protein n=1 Tax=Maribacter sp. 4U21 TaxID=1889779 RepID=UPI000C15052C|nr:hypothetical protein [Maribacter sp. 4U21]PIB28924.1 hypothetical protein BFP77_08380 [Maribacter sp. 4U21]